MQASTLFFILIMCMLLMVFNYVNAQGDIASKTSAPDDSTAALPSKASSSSEGEDALKASVAQKTEVQQNTKMQEGAEAYYASATELLFGHKVTRNYTMAFELLTKAATAGHAPSQFLAGVCSTFGIGVSPSDAVALLLETFASMGNDSDATLALAHRHDGGHGLEESCPAANKYYSKVAKAILRRNNVFIPKTSAKHVRIGVNAPQEPTTDAELVAYYRHMADNGHVQSLLTLGYTYLYGQHGVPQNGALAERYFSLALKNGNTAAHGALGQLYIHGLDSVEGAIEANATLAKEHFVNGTAKSDAVSINGLGYLESQNDGITNMGYIQSLFQKAADMGSAEAMYNLGTLLLEDPSPSVQEKGVMYIEKASNQKQIFALVRLAEMYNKGEHVLQSCVAAKEMYKLVMAHSPIAQRFEDALNAYLKKDYLPALLHYLILSEVGYETAHHNAAYIALKVLHQNDLAMFFAGRNPEEAKHALTRTLYEREAKQGSVPALVSIGDLHYFGHGTPVAYDRAKSYYKQAADKRSAEGAFNCGYMHQHGIGMPADPHLAKRYYDMAIEFDPHATVPVTLALVWLYVDAWMENPSWGIPNLGVKSVSAASSKASGNGGKDKKASSPFMRWASTVETLLLYFLVALFLFLLYLRCTL